MSHRALLVVLAFCAACSRKAAKTDAAPPIAPGDASEAGGGISGTGGSPPSGGGGGGGGGAVVPPRDVRDDEALAVPDTGGMPSVPPPEGNSVLQRNHHANRDGLYVQPTLSKAAVGMLAPDTTFAATFASKMHASPLYVED